MVLGERLRAALRTIDCPHIIEIRGRGLLNAIVVDPKWERTATEACYLMKDRGVLAKYTHQHIIRLAPPLVITEDQIDECVNIIKGVIHDLTHMKKEDLPLPANLH